MAKKKGEEEGKKKKPIVPIILLVGGLFAGKTFFGGGGAEKTPEQIEAEHAAAEAELLKTCREANGIATEEGEGHGDTSTSDGVHETATEETMANHGQNEGAQEGGDETLELINAALISATRPAQGRPARPTQGGGGAASAVPSVLELDSVTVNLADGHYLKLGLALQLKAGMTAEAAGQEGLGAKALDMALERLSAKEMPELISAEARAEIKQQLGLDTCLAYEGEVTTVYFTEFVMQ
jgi:flagellar FliL protein